MRSSTLGAAAVLVAALGLAVATAQRLEVMSGSCRWSSGRRVGCARPTPSSGGRGRVMTGETWTVTAVGVSVIGVTLGSHTVLWRAVAALGVRVDALGVQFGRRGSPAGAPGGLAGSASA